MLSRVPILQTSYWQQEFQVHADASSGVVGDVLTQWVGEGWFYPIYYASQSLTKVENNYSTTK